MTAAQWLRIWVFSMKVAGLKTGKFFDIVMHLFILQ